MSFLASCSEERLEQLQRALDTAEAALRSELSRWQQLESPRPAKAPPPQLRQATQSAAPRHSPDWHCLHHEGNCMQNPECGPCPCCLALRNPYVGADACVVCLQAVKPAVGFEAHVSLGGWLPPTRTHREAKELRVLISWYQTCLQREGQRRQRVIRTCVATRSRSRASGARSDALQEVQPRRADAPQEAVEHRLGLAHPLQTSDLAHTLRDAAWWMREDQFISKPPDENHAALVSLKRSWGRVNKDVNGGGSPQP